MIERSDAGRDRVWCQALISVLEIRDVARVLAEFNRVRPDAAQQLAEADRGADPWWERMSEGDVAAELSATFDLGLPVCHEIAKWMLSPVAPAAQLASVGRSPVGDGDLDDLPLRTPESLPLPRWRLQPLRLPYPGGDRWIICCGTTGRLLRLPTE